MEERDIGQLTNNIRDQASNDDSTGCTEYGIEGLGRYGGDRRGRHVHGCLKQAEFENDHRHTDVRDKSNSRFPVILIQQIRDDKRNRKRDHSGRHHDRVELLSKNADGER